MSGGPTRLLLVEDEAIIALAERRMLTTAGYEVEIAVSGEAAIAALEAGRVPDLILMDINLGPGMEGTEAAKAILRKWRLPIVFLSSHSSKEMVDKVRDITRYGYIVKHSGDFIITSTIEMALELFAKEEALEARNGLLERAERAAGLGYWFVEPGSRQIALSQGSRDLLGIDATTLTFEEFGHLVCADHSERRALAFKALVEEGIPYDQTYALRRPDSGEVVTMHSSARVVNGQILGVLQDVTRIRRLLGDLHRMEARQAVTLQSIGDGVIATDKAGVVMDINKAAQELTGWTASEALGKPIVEVFDIVNASTRMPVENPIKKVMETGYVVGLANHTILIGKGGRERHIADSAAPIRDESGQMLGMVLTFRDVSDSYKAEEELRRNAELFETLFVESHTPMLIVDPASGRLEGTNKAAEAFYGWTADILLTMSISQINTLPPDRIAGEMDRAATTTKRHFSFRHRLASGEVREVLVSSGPIHIDGRQKLLSIVYDAAELRKTEILGSGQG